MRTRTPLAAQRVVQAAGGPSAVADTLGLFKQAVSRWTFVPPEHAPELESMSGIPRERIRPDVYREARFSAEEAAAVVAER